MKLPFPKTSSFKIKQELCRQIAEAYDEKSLGISKESSDSTRKFVSDIAGGKPPEELAPYQKGMIKTTVPYFLLGTLLVAADYGEQARRYERLAKSPRLYLKSEAGLRRTLEGLPPRRTEIPLPRLVFR